MHWLEIQQISKRYQAQTAVHPLSLTVEQGEFLTLLGPSGCGKTTTLRMIAGFIRPDSGRISLQGRPLVDVERGIFVPPERRGMGMVFQSYAVWPHMNVFDNVAYPLRLQKVARRALQARVEEALQLVALDGFAQRYPHQLSGGQQQRVALARALVARPQVLLLDEPLSNLDARLRDSMRQEIAALQKRLGITVVYVTHDQAEAMAMSDRILVMREGRVLQIDTPRAIYHAPAERFVAEFIGAANFLPCRVLSQSEGTARVALTLGAGGQSLVLDAVRRAALGESAWLMVRPEHIRLIEPQADGLRGQVSRITYLGDRLELEVLVEGWRLRVLAAEQPELPALGESVGLALERGAALPDEAPAGAP